MNFYLEYAKSFHRLLGTFNYDLIRRRTVFFQKRSEIDFKSIPIFIISFNRLSYLRQLVDQLSGLGYKNIKIIDNASTYPPLLDYYATIPYEVFRLKINGGHMVFWENDYFKEYRNDLYVVTDPDIRILDECPNDFMDVFFKTLKRYPRLRKAGFSLRIDDIPEEATLYEQVNQWENAFTRFKIPFRNSYTADIDTTFALYIPDQLDISRRFLTAVRMGYPYQIRHLPWYKTKTDVTEEDLYYAQHRTNGFWNEALGDMTSEGRSGVESGWSR